MRLVSTMLATATLLLTAVAASWAEQPEAARKPPAKSTAAKADVPNPVQLRAQLHRTMAELIEAQASAEPDQAKIAELTKQVQALRQQIGAAGSARLDGQAPQAAPAPGWRCPWGGPGLGRGRGAGYGPGPGWGGGRGQGYGPGPGYGRGPGGGRGWGYGPGPGYGRGAGFGAFIDADNDGICDNYERFWDKNR